MGSASSKTIERTISKKPLVSFHKEHKSGIDVPKEKNNRNIKMHSHNPQQPILHIGKSFHDVTTNTTDFGNRSNKLWTRSDTVRLGPGRPRHPLECGTRWPDNKRTILKRRNE